jgi:ABC-type antimicrobial peptide transport system permease subunit
VGYNAENLLVFRTNRTVLQGDRVRYEAMIEKVAATPGVADVTASFDPFIGLSGSFSSYRFRPPDGVRAPEASSGRVRILFVRENFFEVLGIPIVRGRGFEAADGQGGRRVAVITESLARTFGSDPIGWRFGREGLPDVEVVGVAKNVGVSEIQSTGFLSPTHGIIFFPEMQQGGFGAPSFAGVLEVRTTTNPMSRIGEIRAALREVHPDLRAFEVATDEQSIERKLAPLRRMALAWILFGGFAVLLTCIGLYGLLSYTVARRTNEIGIRIALGARYIHVYRLVLGQMLWLVGLGLVLGLVASMIVSQSIRALIFGITFYDPVSIAFAIAVMLAVAALASYLPVRKASRVDPTIALRYE